MSLRSRIGVAAATLALVAVATPAVAQPSVNQGFDPIVPRLVNRPATLIETDSYVYGPGTGKTSPNLSITIQDNDWDAPATLYVYWHDRVNNDVVYVNTKLGLSPDEVDFFGDVGAPRRIIPADLKDFPIFGSGGAALGATPEGVPGTTGRYQFVLEIRDANGAAVVSRSNALYNYVDGVMQHSGDVTANERWTSDMAHFIATPLYVKEQVRLSIDPGTVVIGSKNGQGTLVFERGARMDIVGKPLDPIIMTSELDAGQRGPGDWGGLVVNGRATTNQGVNPPPEGEGDSGPFGGLDDNDSSGALSYARIEYAGIRFSTQNELNGIALQGVGSGTQIDHVQVHFNQDDGIEFFGGTVDAKYVLVTGAEDDSLDWTFGWRGRLQNFVAIQCGNSEQDNGIEADNFETDNTAEPIANPTIRNATWIGDADHLPDASDDGAVFRRGTKVTLVNGLFWRFTTEGINIDGDVSNGWLNGNGITVADTILFGNAPDANVDFTALGGPIMDSDPGFYNDPRGAVGCGVVPDITFANNHDKGSPGSGSFFESQAFVGGVDDDDQWIDDGWTSFADN